MKPEKTPASDWRIKPDAYNSWALCRPMHDKDGAPKLEKDGSPIYRAFRYYTTIERALRAWHEMLLADECSEKANDLIDVIEALNRVEVRFVTSHRSALDTSPQRDLPSSHVPGSVTPANTRTDFDRSLTSGSKGGCGDG